MHDVLCRYDRALRLADLSRLSGKPAAAIDQEIWQSGFEAEGDAGRLDGPAYLHGFGQRLGYPITLEEFLANRRLANTPMDDVLAIMAALKTRVEVGVLTNNHNLVAEHIGFLFPQLAVLAGSRFFVSAQFGAVKPQPAVYLKCVALLGRLPGDVLFIDDSAANVAGARAAGLLGHQFTGAAALETELASHRFF